MFSDIRLITFDLDDTLWPCHQTIREAERTLFDWLSEQAPALTADHTITSMREHRAALSRNNPAIAHDLTETRLRSLAQLASEYQLPESLPHEANAVFREARNLVFPYEEVIPVLRELGRRFQLVAVSNGNAQVEKTPLQGCFHHSFMAEEVGAAKPDPALFHAASVATGIPLAATLHVGDDPLRDVHAARQAGLSAVWVNRDGKPWPDDIEPPDAEIRHLEQLLRLL